ncbi:MAG: NTP transferase domain-containing protein, partial [Candidatus Ornithospirochaeta sp.]
MTTIVLAAGLSERMGQNKLLLPFKGETIIVKTVTTALSFSDRVIVVVGNARERVEEALSSFPVDIVFNKDYKMGQRTSTLEGVKAVEDDDFAILPGDLP